MSTPRKHWDDVYRTKTPEAVSWYQSRPQVSLDLIAAYAPDRNAAIIDVGGGASMLTDHLLDAGYGDLSVLDISLAGLAHLKERLGARGDRVDWIAADVTQWKPARHYDLWHDRAVLHFLTEPDDQKVYAENMRAALARGGIAIIAGFAPDGPSKCSGLPVVHHDQVSLARLLGDGFAMLEMRDETHRTPWNAEQAFRYHIFRRTLNRPK